jgi:hypothetical protein
VVDVFAVSRANLSGDQPSVFLEVRGNLEVLVVDRAVRRDVELGRHLENHVRLSDLPSVGERGQRRQLRRIALTRVGIHPLHDRVDLRLRQAPIVLERAMLLIGKPRRHRPRADLVADRPGPRPHVLEGDERHRRDFAWPMACHALAVQNRRDVLAERRRVLRRRHARPL